MAGPARKREPVYAFGEHSLAHVLHAYFRWHLEGLEYIPAEGPAIVASNHLSYLDGLSVAFAVNRAGRRPRFLAKSGLFKVPVIGPAMRGLGQIPVDRGTRDAPASLDSAKAALERGEVVVVFAEGTTSTTPDLALGRPKSGTARLALASGIDVIPCATWGGQWIWTKHLGVHLKPRQDVYVRFGPPISLKNYEGREGDRKAWREVSTRMMDEIGTLLADLREAKPWTPREPTRKKFIAEQQAKAAAAQGGSGGVAAPSKETAGDARGGDPPEEEGGSGGVAAPSKETAGDARGGDPPEKEVHPPGS